MKKEGKVIHFLKNEALVYQGWLDASQSTENPEFKKLEHPAGIAKKILNYSIGGPQMRKFQEMGLLVKTEEGYLLKVVEYQTIFTAGQMRNISNEKENVADDLLQKSQNGRIKSREELENEKIVLLTEISERQEKISNIEKVLTDYEIIKQVLCV